MILYLFIYFMHLIAIKIKENTSCFFLLEFGVRTKPLIWLKYNLSV